mgnify:CR=1 FL=1
MAPHFLLFAAVSFSAPFNDFFGFVEVDSPSTSSTGVGEFAGFFPKKLSLRINVGGRTGLSTVLNNRRDKLRACCRAMNRRSIVDI